MPSKSAGYETNAVILQHGVIALVSLEGDHVMMFPRGKLSASVGYWLHRDRGLRLKVLRNFLVNLGRGIHDDLR